MPQSKEVHREYMRKYRQGLQGGSQRGSQEGRGVHPIVYTLADKEKRLKLGAICQSLKEHNVLEGVYYGVRRPLLMSEVADLLTVVT